MTLQEYIVNKFAEKTAINIVQDAIANDPQLSPTQKRLWIDQISQASRAKDTVELLAILFNLVTK